MKKRWGGADIPLSVDEIVWAAYGDEALEDERNFDRAESFAGVPRVMCLVSVAVQAIVKADPFSFSIFKSKKEKM